MRNSKFLMTLVIVFLMVGSSMALTKFGIQAGYAGSAFEDQPKTGSGLAIGAHFGVDIIPLIEVGAEVNYTVKPFSYTENIEGVDVDIKASQMYYGVYGKFVPLPLIVVDPYIKGGIGYYSGNVEFSAAGQTQSFDYKGSLGYQIGLGVELPLGIYGEFVYNIVKQKIDVENAEEAGANNWMLSVGYRF